MNPRLRRRPRRRLLRQGRPTATNKTTVGGHLLAANRDRGLGPHTAIVHRHRYFVKLPKHNPRDKPHTAQGTRP